MSPSVRKTEIVYSPQMLEAELWTYKDSADACLKVKIGKRVQPTGKLYKRVADFLSTRCTSELLREKKDDETWIGGSFTEVEHAVYQECPGEALDHDCASARSGTLKEVKVEWLLITGR